MFAWTRSVALGAGLAALALGCGSDESRTLFVEERTPERIAGRFLADDRVIEFSSTRREELSGDVEIDVGALTYAVHYDYAAGEVVSDGQGGALDRATQRMLNDSIEVVTAYLGPDDPELLLHEQMLYAGLGMLIDSAGMPLERMTFALELSDTDPSESEKSLSNDGVGCIKRNLSYYASFDYGSSAVVDRVVTANRSKCNGRCGPGCTQLTPWNMWTLDCLEHDACCVETSDNNCWTPLGQCGDEYVHAETDFLRGFDPFRKHCGG
jgi:hypothetical protein